MFSDEYVLSGAFFIAMFSRSSFDTISYALLIMSNRVTMSSLLYISWGMVSGGNCGLEMTDPSQAWIEGYLVGFAYISRFGG